MKSVAFNTLGSYLAQLDNLPAKFQKVYTTGVQSDKEIIRIAALDSLISTTAKLESSEKINQVY